MRSLATHLCALTGVAALTFAVGGCQSGGSTPPDTGSAPASSARPSTSAGARDVLACALATEAEATTALGADPGPGQESAGGPGVHTCIYGGVTGAGVRISLDESGAGKAIYDGTRSSYPAGSRTDVPGVGDGAFEITTSDSQVTADLYRGDTFVAITVDTAATSGPPPIDQVTVLATSAAGRI